MKPKIADLEKRIEELEKKLKLLTDCPIYPTYYPTYYPAYPGGMFLGWHWGVGGMWYGWGY